MRSIFKLGELAHTGPTAQTVTRSSLGQRQPQLVDQNRILGQAQAVVNLRLALAPGHDLFPAKTAVPTHDNARPAATLANGGHQLLERGHRSVGRLVFGGAQLRPQRKVPHKRVERQITIIVIVGVEVPALLKPVQPMAHRVQIQHDLLGVFGQTAHPHFQQASLNLGRVVRDFMAAGIFVIR